MANTTTLPAKLAGLSAVLNTLADTVRATCTLIEAVSAQVPDQTRSVVVNIVNLSSRSLTIGRDGFDYGGFGPVLPAAVIPPFHSDMFTMVSIGRREREEPDQLVTVDVRKRTQPLQVSIGEQPARHRPPLPVPATVRRWRAGLSVAISTPLPGRARPYPLIFGQYYCARFPFGR
jgi:hypothetical protein